MTKRILITGGAGFIGSNLHVRCLQEGWSVFSVDDYSNGHQEFVPKDSFCLKSDFADCRVLDMIKQQQFDVVMHIAAVPRVGYSVDHPLETNNTNVTKTLMLMDACRGNIKRFIFASSSSVYGGSENLPTHEFMQKNPNSPYALQKSVIEDYLRLYSQLYDFDSMCLRFFNVFGENQLGDSPYACAVSAWLTQIMKNKPMRSDGDGTQSRDLCHVDNVTDCCIRAAKLSNNIDKFSIVNVACGDRTSNNEIMSYLKKQFPKATHYDSPWRPGDVMHTQADISQAKILLGYEPIVRIWEGIDRTIKWYHANKNLVTNRRLAK